MFCFTLFSNKERFVTSLGELFIFLAAIRAPWNSLFGIDEELEPPTQTNYKETEAFLFKNN